MATLMYVIETWRGSDDNPIKLCDKGFPADHWHEQTVGRELQCTLEEILGYEFSWGRATEDWDWDESMERIIPFTRADRAGHLCFKIDLKDTDGTTAVHLVLPMLLEDEND